MLGLDLLHVVWMEEVVPGHALKVVPGVAQVVLATGTHTQREKFTLGIWNF